MHKTCHEMGDFLEGFQSPDSFRCGDRWKWPHGSDHDTLSEGHFSHGIRGSDVQWTPSSFPSTPRNNRFGMEVHRSNPLSSRSSPRSKFVGGSSHYSYSTSSQKRVYLHKWFLIRVVEDHPDNDITHNGVQVALGGYTISDLVGHEQFRTAPIESRTEKCMIRTVDGLDIVLMGVIDDRTTYDNGFPFQVIHLFLTGFPYNWKHVINMCFSESNLNKYPLPYGKEEEYAGQEKDEALNSESPGAQVGNTGSGNVSFLDREENMPKVELNVSKVTSSANKRRHLSEPVRSSKRLKFSKLSMKCETETHSPFVKSHDDSNTLKESEGNVSLCFPNVSVKKKDDTPEHMFSDMEAHDQFDRDDTLTGSGNKLSTMKSSYLSVSQTENCYVESKGNVLKCSVSHTMKEMRRSKKLVDKGSFLDGGKSTRSSHMFKMPSSSENQTENHFPNAEKVVYQRIENKEAMQSTDALFCSAEKKLCSLADNQINNDVNQCSKQVNGSDVKRKGRNRKKTRCTDPPSEHSERYMSSQTCVADGVMQKCNDIDANCGTNLYPVTSEIEHVMQSKHYTEIQYNSIEKNCDSEEGSMQRQKTSTGKDVQTRTSKGKLDNKLPSLPPRRVQTTPEEVSKAFGLKTSRSGRLLVPPLAHWCNQTIAYDMDGGIIAILEGSSERNKYNDGFNFKPPQQKDSIRIRNKLYNAANEIIRTPSSGKKVFKD